MQQILLKESDKTKIKKKTYITSAYLYSFVVRNDLSFFYTIYRNYIFRNIIITRLKHEIIV